MQNCFVLSWTAAISRRQGRNLICSSSGTFEKEVKLSQGVPNYLHCFAMAIGEQHLSFMFHKDNSCSSAVKSLIPTSCFSRDSREELLVAKNHQCSYLPHLGFPLRSPISLMVRLTWLHIQDLAKKQPAVILKWKT